MGNMAFPKSDQYGHCDAFTQQDIGITSSPNDGKITVYEYTSKKPMKFDTTLNCEEICTEICRVLNIKPFVQLIYGICERPNLSSKSKTKSKSNYNDNLNRIGFWPLPGECLDSKLSYSFRIRFRIPEMERQLQRLDPESFNYLYYQMRHDMVHEQISEIRYPDHKDKILGLVVFDMLIDLQIVLERDKAAKELEINSDSRAKAIMLAYKSYLPCSIRKNHGTFTYSPIRKSFQKINGKQFTLDQQKLHYISSICLLAPNYMIMDQYLVTVGALPNEDDSGGTPLGSSSSIPNTNKSIKVLVRLWTHVSTEPGLKIARISAKPKWILVAIMENIERAMVKDKKLSLEINDMVEDFDMTFGTAQEMKSFLSYLNTYKRLTGLWLKDLCPQYRTPSLQDLYKTSFHGPIGGIYSLRKLNDFNCGSYIIRQCDQEYFTYYIDINVKRENTSDTHRRFDTKIFKIQRAEPPSSPWILHEANGQTSSHETLISLVLSIETEDGTKECVPPLLNDKYPELLLCLPKTLMTKKTHIQLSEFELRSRKPQVVDGPKDLIHHMGTKLESNDNFMITRPGDWIQKGSIKDVRVTLKTLHDEGDIATFINMTAEWGRIESPLFLKLYALTQLSPFTMVMQYPKYGPLNEFLKPYPAIGISSLKLVLRDLTRGINYLKENDIAHNFIRCSNLFVTGFKPPHILVKIGDPGYPRPYNDNDFAWIPLKFYDSPEKAKNDPGAQYWAFATTTYEIFSRCEEDLIEKKDVPDEIKEIIMDGWGGEKDFDPDAIISSINNIQCCLDEKPLHEIVPLSKLSPYYSENNDFPEYTVVSNRVNALFQLNGGSVEFEKDEKNILGSGHFGVVFSGHYKRKDGIIEKVAIKELKDSIEKIKVEDFKNEIDIMKPMSHPNVVKLMHWSAKYIIMEFLDYSLDEILKTILDLPREELEYFALEIARGMEYLAKKDIVHRDLATRNVLVEKNRKIVKIADFGLSKKLDDNGIYTGITARPCLPVAWFSPEAMEYKKFSMYSDIWSYGVTLYEIFTRGSTPPLSKTASTPKEMAAYLGQKDRFPRPQPLEACADFVYNDIMLECWNEKPTDRPTFTMIIDILTKNIGASNTMNPSQQQDQQVQPQQHHPEEHQDNQQPQQNQNGGYIVMNAIMH